MYKCIVFNKEKLKLHVLILSALKMSAAAQGLEGKILQ